MTLNERAAIERQQHNDRLVSTILTRASERKHPYSFIGIFETEGGLLNRYYKYRASGSAQLLLACTSDFIVTLRSKEALVTEEKWSEVTRQTALYIYV